MNETRRRLHSGHLNAGIGAMPADQPYGPINIWDREFDRVPPRLRQSVEQRILARQQARNRAKSRF